jgi:hypothetical protein
MLAGKKTNMWARKLTNELLVAGPFLMLAIMAIKSRTYFDPWESPHNNAEVEARVDAFVGPMKAASKLGDYTDASQLRTVAQLWVDDAAPGKLKPLSLCTVVDSMRDGVKGQIVTTKNHMTSTLEELSQVELAQGNRKQALSDSLLAYRLAEVIKYSDFSTVYDTVRGQMHALKTLKECIPGASASERREVATVVLSSGFDAKPLNRILLQTRTNYAECLRAQGRRSLPIEDTQQFAQVGSMMQAKCDDRGVRQMRSLIVASNGEMPRILTTAKLAWQMENARFAAVKELVSQIQEANRSEVRTPPATTP